MTLPDAPFFVHAIAPRNSGVDFLGLAAVGERLVALALPGINNVTRYVRAYSMASWVAWQFDAFLKASDGRRLPAEPKVLFRRFREKVELTFSWANRDFDAAIGKRRRYPGDADDIVMAFKNAVFGAESQASWFAAAAYGPSFASSSGLGFVGLVASPSNARGVAHPTARGSEMAKAFDAMLRKAGRHTYTRLADVQFYKSGARDIAAVAPWMTLDGISPAEQAVFRDALFKPALVGRYDSSDGSRSSTIDLMLRSLRAAGELDAQGVRECLARGMTGTGRPIACVDVQPTRRLWFVLSVRQLQRVALERLLTWLEAALVQHSAESVDLARLVAIGVEQLRAANPDVDSSTVGHELDSLAELLRQRGGPERAGLAVEWLDVFGLRAQLVAADPAGESTVPALSLAALLLCGAIVKVTQDDASLRELYSMGGAERCGLRWLVLFLESRRGATLGQALGAVITSLVYGQHLRTAAARFEEGKNKFRFSADDAGLQLLIGPESISGQLDTPDRIGTALHLMTDCGLVAQKEGVFCVE